MVFTDWTSAVRDTWTNVWDRFVNFLPNIIGAAIIIVIGWIVGMLIEILIDRLFRIIGLQTLFEKAKVEDVLKKGSLEKDATAMLAAVAKWIIYLVAFVAAADTLKLPDVASFLNKILAYLPSVAAAGAILLIGLILANFLGSVVKASVTVAKLGSADTVAAIVRYAIIVFTFIAVLMQLGIAQSFLNTFFIGVVAFFAIAGGLAFGLGGKDVAAEWLENFKKQMK